MAIAVSLLGAASLLGRLVTGWLLDRSSRRDWRSALALGARRESSFSGAHSLAAGSQIAAVILIGVGMVRQTSLRTYCRDTGPRSFSMLYGFSWTAYAIACVIGPVLMTGF